MKLFTVICSLSLLLATSGCASATSAPVKTWTESACTQNNQGTSLTVSYLGKTTTHCATKFSGNSWDLISASGFKVVGTAKYPTAFACKINGEPKAAKCDDSDDPNAYWGYYLAKAGKWDYATTGASEHQAVCGTHEAWFYMETLDTVLELPKPSEFSCSK